MRSQLGVGKIDLANRQDESFVHNHKLAITIDLKRDDRMASASIAVPVEEQTVFKKARDSEKVKRLSGV